MSWARALLAHEAATALRGAAGWAFAPVFFLLFCTLSVFAIGHDGPLAMLGPALIWLAATFSILLAAQTVFRDDLENGFLDALMVEDRSLALFVAARLAARWVAIAGTLLLALPLAGAAFGLSWEQQAGLALSLVLGTPGAILYAAAGAAISAGARGAGEILGPLLAGPLLTPVLIFGAGAAQAGFVFGAEAQALLAASLFAAAVCPPTCAAALRAANT